MQPQHFTIEGFDLTENEIEVRAVKYDICIPIFITRSKFEWWLRLEDKLQWVFDISDHTGEHQQFTGCMSLEEYWDTGSKAIEQDLMEYIVSHPISRDGVVYTNSLESLLLAFDLHNAHRVEPQRWEHEQDIETQLLN